VAVELTEEAQARTIALLRQKAGIAESGIRAEGGDTNALYALGSARNLIDALERNAERRRESEDEELRAMWMRDALECERIIDSLPGDARQAAGRVSDALAYVAKATATQVAAGVGAAASFGWALIPTWAKVGGGLVLAAGLAFVGWRVSRAVAG
jgi:hypothetical protein